MSDFFYRMLSRLTGYAALLVVLGLYALSTNVEIRDLDIWLHLKMGKFIVEHGFVPSVDVLSASIAGKPWGNHEWLFQVVLYTIKNLWGFDGLITMQVIVVLLTVSILLMLGYHPQRQVLVAVLLVLVLFNYQMRFTIRPDIFSLLFFALYMQILSMKLHERWSVLAIFVIQVLWSNMHGFFFFGPVFVSMAVIAEFLKRNVRMPYQWNEVGRLTDEEYKRLQLIWIVVIGACFMNPSFIEGAVYPLKVLMNVSGDTKTFFKHITELQRPITSWANFLDKNSYQHYKILIIISALSFVFNRRRIDVAALLFWAAFLVFSLAAVRNLVFFSFAAYLVVLVNALSIRLDDILPIRFSQQKFKHITAILIKLILIFWMIDFGSRMSNNGYFDYDTFERKSEFGGVSTRGFPYKAVDFLVHNHVKGNFLNDFNSGAYLIGRTYPNIKPFIDGRTEVYGADFFVSQYMKIWQEGDEKVFDELTEKFNLIGAFLHSNSYKIPDKLAKMISKKTEWIPVYFDYDALILLKNVPQNKELIDRFKIDFKTWEPPDFDLQELGSKQIGIRPQLIRAQTLISFEYYDLALQELDMAAKLSPQEAEIYKLRAKIFHEQKKYRESFEDIRIATSMIQSDPDTRTKLALAYEDLGDCENAIKQLKRTTVQAPNAAVGFYALARCHARNGDLELARKALHRAYDLEPGNAEEMLKMGDIMYDLGEYLRAQAIYSKALYGQKDSANVHYKIGKASLALEEYDKAKLHFEKGVAADGEHQELRKALEDLSRQLQDGSLVKKTEKKGS